MIINEILKHWNLGANTLISLENIDYEIEREVHIWNINNEYILKATNSENEIKNNIYISKLLSKAEIPTQRLIKTIDGQDYIEAEDKFYGVFTRIKGKVLKDYFSGDYLERGFYLGQCLGKLHKGLEVITEELKENKVIFDNDMIKELNGWVNEEINSYLLKCKLDNDRIVSFKNIKRSFDTDFKNLYYKLPRQAIHRDFQGENMIFNNGKLVGYIDFDLTQVNARLFDICYLCTGALATVFNKESERSKWLGFAKSAIDGYNSENKIIKDEIDCIKYMMFAIEFIMIAFFSKEGYSNIADLNIEIINWIEENWK